MSRCNYDPTDLVYKLHHVDMYKLRIHYCIYCILLLYTVQFISTVAVAYP